MTKEELAEYLYNNLHKVAVLSKLCKKYNLDRYEVMKELNKLHGIK